MGSAGQRARQYRNHAHQVSVSSLHLNVIHVYTLLLDYSIGIGIAYYSTALSIMVPCSAKLLYSLEMENINIYTPFGNPSETENINIYIYYSHLTV